MAFIWELARTSNIREDSMDTSVQKRRTQWWLCRFPSKIVIQSVLLTGSGESIFRSKALESLVATNLGR